MKAKLLGVACALVLLAGCAGGVITPQKLATYQTDSAVNSLVYAGTDDNYHYFERWQNMNPVRKFKVPVADLDWPGAEKPYNMTRKRPVFPGTVESVIERTNAARADLEEAEKAEGSK